METNWELKFRILKSYRTQQAFAAEIGEHDTAVSRIANGWRNPTDEQKVKFAKALKCEIEDIFPGK